MTHFTVLVKIPKCKNVADARRRLEAMLAPYSENLEVEPYKSRMDITDVYRMVRHYLNKNLPDHDYYPKDDELEFEKKIVKNLTPKDIETIISKMEDWCGNDGGLDDEGFFYWSHYNPNSKWDWYSLGGRWMGMLVPKSNGAGYTGETGVFDNEKMHPNGVDLVRADLLDVDKSGWVDEETKIPELHTHSVLDKHGWHEPSKMGWFAVTYDETEDEDTWRAKFKERWLTDLPHDMYIALVDCHI